MCYNIFVLKKYRFRHTCNDDSTAETIQM